jgi:hypothetical protein
MTRILLLSGAALLILTGCAQKYIITTRTGERIEAKNRPRLVNGWYVYKDMNGQQAAEKSIAVREIAPASMATQESQEFKPVSSK